MAADRQTAIGAFVAAAIVLGLAAIVLFGNFRLFSPTTRAAVVFEGSISGLSVGAPVTFRGVRVGDVSAIVLQFQTQTRTAYIPVTLNLEPDRVRVSGGREAGVNLAGLIARGLRAQLNTQSFVTGQAEVDLDFAPSSPAVLHPEVTSLLEIPTRPSTLQRVKDQLSQLPLRELVGDADATLNSVRALAQKLDTDLPPLVASLRTTSDHSSHAVDVATQAIAGLQGKVDATLDNVNRLAIDANQRLNQRSADLHTVLTSANQTALLSHEVLADLRGLTSSRGEVRANLEATLRDLAASAASLRGFANDVEHNPQLLLTGRRQ